VLLQSVGAVRLNEINANIRRRAYMAYFPSANNTDSQEMSKYNCAGIFFDVSGPSKATYGSEQIDVKYAYDLFLAKGSNMNKAVIALQSRLLQHVGESIFTDCSSDQMITEVTMASNDVQHPTESCKIEAEFDVETECFPMKGKATVYYSPSEQSDENDEELIIKIMSKAVKSAMDSNVLLTDTVIATYFIGERDSFKFRSSEYYYLEGSPGYPDSASWTQRNIGLIAGTAAALVAIIIMICICHKRQKNKAVSDSQSQAVKKEVKKDQLPTKVQG